MRLGRSPRRRELTKPGGDLVFSDSGAGGELKVVTLVVSDGTAESSGSVSLSVKPAGEVPIEADPFVVLGVRGQGQSPVSAG